jgi:4-hydroxy-tetrahydrodipicolinate synthase
MMKMKSLISSTCLYWEVLLPLLRRCLRIGNLDYPALRNLLDWHVEQGTHGIVIVGTSGESPTVNVTERCELIRISVEHIN